MKAYQLKIELIGSNPLIWRRVIIPAGATFYRLYETIQNSMGWMGNSINESHLYEFDIREEKLRITNDIEAYYDNKFYKTQYKNVMLNEKNDPRGIIAENIRTTIRQSQTIKIDTYIEKYRSLNYIYDFGDDWKHHIILEDILQDYHYGYPTLIGGERNCPPEDVGGLGGYEEFLKIYNNPNHSKYKETLAWLKQQYYREFDKDFINRILKFIKFKKTEWDKL